MPAAISLEKILWIPDLAARWGCNRLTVIRREKAGMIPKPDFVQGNRRGRYLSTIERFERSTTKSAPAAAVAA